MVREPCELKTRRVGTTNPPKVFEKGLRVKGSLARKEGWSNSSKYGGKTKQVAARG